MISNSPLWCEPCQLTAPPAVPDVPMLEDPELRQIAIEQNLIGPHTAGQTIGYGIFGAMSARRMKSMRGRGSGWGSDRCD